MDASNRDCAFCGQLAPVLCTRCSTPHCPRDGQRVCDGCIAEVMAAEEYDKGGLVYPYGTQAAALDGMERLKTVLDDTNSRLLINVLSLMAAPLLTIVSLLGFIFIPFAGRWVLVSTLFLFLTMSIVAVVERQMLTTRQDDVRQRIAHLRAKYAQAALEKPVVQRVVRVPQALMHAAFVQ